MIKLPLLQNEKIFFPHFFSDLSRNIKAKIYYICWTNQCDGYAFLFVFFCFLIKIFDLFYNRSNFTVLDLFCFTKLYGQTTSILLSNMYILISNWNLLRQAASLTAVKKIKSSCRLPFFWIFNRNYFKQDAFIDLLHFHIIIDLFQLLKLKWI